MKFRTADGVWSVEPAELELADHTSSPNANGERLIVRCHGIAVGDVPAHRTPDGAMLDAATLAELARLGVPLAELVPDLPPAPSGAVIHWMPAPPA